MDSKVFVLLISAYILLTGQKAAGWNFRWRNLQKSDGLGCSSSLRSELNNHVNEALLDILMYRWKGEINSTVPEICDSTLHLTESAFLESNVNNVCLNPHSGSEVHFVESYYRLMNIDINQKAIGAIPAVMNYQDPSNVINRGYFDQPHTRILTSGPSQNEIADAVYRLTAQNGWSYMVLMIETEAGAMKLSQALHTMANTDKRACFPLTITFNTKNATEAAKSLKNFAYPKMTGLTVVYAGSGSTFLSLWDLVTGSGSAHVDSEKRYQFVLVGDAFGTFHKMSDTHRRRHFGLGTIFIFPGILDPNPATDQMARLIYNISSSASSMGEYSPLIDTFSRLQSLKASTSSTCNWGDLNDMCFMQSLMYDYHLLSLVTLSGTSADFNTLTAAQSLRRKTVTLADLRSTFPFIDAFIEQNYTTYSLANGLGHKNEGFWQPIVKVYQSQLSSSASATLVKLGELRVRQAGYSDQSYEWDLSKTPMFYKFNGGDPDNIPTSVLNIHSVCPNSCPECNQLKGKQYVDFKHGDIYIGAVLPIYNHGTDLYKCNDGSFYTNVAEWFKAFKFVMDLTNWASQGAPLPPPGVEPTLVDAQFLLGLKDLLSKVQQSHVKKLTWGYVILDSCYAAPFLTNQLGLLLDGKLEPLIGLNYSKFAGFIGELSSTQTMAASQVLKQYSIPIISHASTSTALGNIFQYPFTMRTVASDNEIVEAMMAIIKHYKVDIITVMSTPNAYGQSLRNSMLTKASKSRICIAHLLIFDCSFSDNSCKRSLALQLRNAGTRYVAFLGDGSDLEEFLNYPQVESDLEFITIFGTEGIDEAHFTGKGNLGVGTTMVQLVSAPEPGFLKFLNYTMSRIPENSNNMTQWDRLYFEMVHQCYLTDSFVRSSIYTQPCSSSIITSHQVTKLESRTVFLMTATETLILGCLTAIKYICSVVTLNPACPAFFKADRITQLQRANLIMYGQVTATGTTAQRFSGSYEGTDWSFQQIFENRMGRTPMKLMQYRKIGSAKYEFVQFGIFDGMNSTEFNSTAEQLYKFERQATSDLVMSCRTAAECSYPKCANSLDTGANTVGVTQSSSLLLALLFLMFVPGVLCGLLIAWLTGRLIVHKQQDQEEYADPEYAGYVYPDVIQDEFDNPEGLPVRPDLSYNASLSYENPSSETFPSQQQQPPQPKKRTFNRENSSAAAVPTDS